MLQPDYFTYKSDNLVKLYQSLEDWIIKDISNRLLVAGELSGTADWQLYKLEQMGLHKAEVVKKVAELSGKSKEEVRRLLKDAVLTSYADDKSVFDEMGIDVEKPMLNPSIVAVMDAQLARTNNEFFNLTQTTMNQSSADLMRLMDEAQFRVNSGMQSYSSAICEILDKYAKRGVVIDYPSGAKRSLESAVQCAMLTAMNQTAAQVTNKYIVGNGVEYVLVSAHLGARHDKKHPQELQSHDWWQGKMFKIAGSEKGYPNLLESTGYTIDAVTGIGTVINPLGLHGYNCRHSHTPAFKGMENPYDHPDSAITRAESQKVFENQQKQRSMERSIRSTKRSFLEKQQQVDTITDDALKEQLELERDKLAYKLRMQNKAYNEFCKANDLQTQSFRTKTIGFDKNMSAKARGRATAYEHYEELYKGVPKEWINSGKTLINIKAINESGSVENCANCIVAYEMRQRGFNVIAEDKMNKTLAKSPWKAWENVQVLEDYSKDDIIDLIKATNGNCRYGVAYRAMEQGHCVIIEKYDNNISIIDPQIGERFELEQYPLSNDIKAWKTMENGEFAELSEMGAVSCRMKK